MLDQAKQDIEAALDLMGNDPQSRDVIIEALNNMCHLAMTQRTELVSMIEKTNEALLELSVFLDWIEQIRVKHKL